MAGGGSQHMTTPAKIPGGHKSMKSNEISAKIDSISEIVDELKSLIHI